MTPKVQFGNSENQLKETKLSNAQMKWKISNGLFSIENRMDSVIVFLNYFRGAGLLAMAE